MIGVVAAAAYYLLAGAGKTYAVPLVNNEPVAMAQAQITAAHLRSAVVEQANPTVKKGLVIKLQPPGGQQRPGEHPGDAVRLDRRGARSPCRTSSASSRTRPNPRCRPRASSVDVKPDPTSSAPVGQVTAQSPSGGTAPPDSTVTITVSGGAVTVPSVIGESQATATSVLTQAGFQVNVQQGSGRAQYANGTVFNQVPGNGTAAKGSTVTIYVQTGASPSAPPSASGSPTATPQPAMAAAAAAAAAAAGSEVLAAEARCVRNVSSGGRPDRTDHREERLRLGPHHRV